MYTSINLIFDIYLPLFLIYDLIEISAMGA